MKSAFRKSFTRDLKKIKNRAVLERVGQIIDEVEAEHGMAIGTTKMLAMVETASAFFRIAEIAKAHPRLVGLNLGAEITSPPYAVTWNTTAAAQNILVQRGDAIARTKPASKKTVR